MKKKGFIATTIFGFACFGGVVAMFSQADFRTQGAPRLQHLDVSPARQGVFGDTLPEAIRRGALHRSAPEQPSRCCVNRGNRLTLR